MAQAPNQPAVYVNFDRLTLYTTVEGSDPPVRARLVWSARNGNPRATLFYQNKDGRKNISGGFDQVTFMTVLKQIQEMIKTGVETKQMIRNFIRNKESGEMDIMSELWFGINEDGSLWLAVISASHPRIKFEVRKSTWHSFIGNDGKEYDQRKLNQDYSYMYMELVKITFEQFMANSNLGLLKDGTMEALNPEGAAPEPVTSKAPAVTNIDELDSFNI